MTKHADPKPPRSVRLPLLTWRQLDDLAAKWGESHSAAITRCVDRAHVAEFGERQQDGADSAGKGEQ